MSILPFVKFTIILEETYIIEPILNIVVNYDRLFGKHGDEIDVYVKNWNAPAFKARINRKANTNNTPRLYIMPPKLYTEWVQYNYRIGDLINVTVRHPDYPNAILIE